MAKMKFTKYKNNWSLRKWQEKCPELKYRVVSHNEFPEFLPESLKNKFNCGIYTASGSADVYVAYFNGYRIDKKEIDEHPYVVVINKDNERDQYSGIIHHGDWAGRTTPMPEQMIKLIEASGSHVPFKFTRLPTNESGSVEDLQQQGILNGFVKSIEYTIDKKNKDSNNSD